MDLLAALLVLPNKLASTHSPFVVLLCAIEQAAGTVKHQGSIPQTEQRACP